MDEIEPNFDSLNAIYSQTLTGLKHLWSQDKSEIKWQPDIVLKELQNNTSIGEIIIPEYDLYAGLIPIYKSALEIEIAENIDTIKAVGRFYFDHRDNILQISANHYSDFIVRPPQYSPGQNPFSFYADQMPAVNFTADAVGHAEIMKRKIESIPDQERDFINAFLENIIDHGKLSVDDIFIAKRGFSRELWTKVDDQDQTLGSIPPVNIDLLYPNADSTNLATLDRLYPISLSLITYLSKNRLGDFAILDADLQEHNPVNVDSLFGYPNFVKMFLDYVNSPNPLCDWRTLLYALKQSSITDFIEITKTKMPNKSLLALRNLCDSMLLDYTKV